MNFSAEDLKQLKALDIDPSKALRQLAWLRTGQVDIKLERPCTVGDGIVQIQPSVYSHLNKSFASAHAHRGRTGYWQAAALFIPFRRPARWNLICVVSLTS